MAAEDEGRTEEASEYKLEKARKEGRVAKSQEVSSSLVLLFTVLTLVLTGKWLLGQCTEILRYFFSHCSNPDVKDANLGIAFLNYFIKCIIPVSIISVIAALIGNIIQTRGFIFSTKPLEPNFSKIIPKFGEYFKKTLFSAKGLFNLAKSIGKVIIISVIAYYLVKKDIFVIVHTISNGDINGAIEKIASMSAQLLIIISLLFFVISIPDYFVQRHEFRESMKMTKQEQKEEYKELEGDPEVKNRLKQAQNDLLKQNIPKAVAESDVVITNPTHYAVALKYDQQLNDAPKVNAKGEDQTALYIRRIAQENDIPIVENRPVARGLYTETEIGDIIPDTYIRIIANIYAQILK